MSTPMRFLKTTSQRGLSYVEVLVATVLIALSLVPAMDAMQTGIQTTSVHRDYAIDHYELVARMEELLTEPFGSLQAAIAGPATASSYSENYTRSDGSSVQRNVYLALYDGDNADGDNDPFTGGDGDLIWMQVRFAGANQSMQSLVSQ